MSKILWIDDEIEMLRPHCMSLNNRGHEVSTANNAFDALDDLRTHHYDLIFLDENMPGRSGLDVLPDIKVLAPDTPVVMVTKSEEERVMEEAIGSKIAYYLVKPINSAQLLACIKQLIDKRSLVEKTALEKYQTEYRSIQMQMDACRTFADWASLYNMLIHWELELENTDTMSELLLMQKRDANNGFCRFVKKNYSEWIANPKAADVPLMSNRLMVERVLPTLEKGEKVVLIVIDNCRVDQWELIRQMLAPDFNIKSELYCAILPTATQYARNSIFSGLMPADIKKNYPEYWTDEDDESSQNRFEKELIGTFFERYRKTNFQYAYYKVNDSESGDRIVNKFNNYKQNNLNAFVYNFMDMLSHARTENKIVSQLSENAAAYRSITKSWFEHSPLYNMIKLLGDLRYKIMITTDHGNIRVSNAQRIKGERDLNSNLRFKNGRNLAEYKASDVFELDPDKGKLPRISVSAKYVFATNEDFFVYPNDFNTYVDKYNNTFQHGGISMEEMIVPFAILEAK
ncbi:MAG: bifunctional response regulator/alkaline phosphatase family protein [Bacteroidales bacterium]|nr:bifunctional response regulator/alkaline phosphatase family protein [Bacteroidales bacterium]